MWLTMRAQTKFRHDNFHKVNHTSCSPVFDPKREMNTSAFNTQLCEQFNSFVKVWMEEKKGMEMLTRA